MTKTELNSAMTLQRQLETEKMKLKNVEDWLMTITPKLDGLPKTQSRDSRLENLMAQKLDVENKITALETELISAQCKLLTLFVGLKELSAVELEILRARYVDCKLFSTIAETLHFSETYIFRHHRNAVKKICAG